MWNKRLHDKGYFYIIIAIVCLIIFFMGYKVLGKSSKYNVSQDSEDLDIGQEAIAVFHNNQEKDNKNIKDDIDSKVEDKKINKDNETKLNNFFLKTLLNSNSYMRLAFEKDQGKASSISLVPGLPAVFKKSLRPENYFRSQLPAILSLVNASSYAPTSSRNYDMPSNNEDDDDTMDYEIDDKNFNEVEDIIFVEKPEEGYEGITLSEGDYADILKGINIPKPIKINSKQPYVLIYHSHATEAYLPITTDNFRTEKREYSVISIGDTITEILTQKGHNIIHVDRHHDLPSYNQSYINSLETIKDVMGKNKDLKIIIDIHRDGIPESSSRSTKTTIDGKTIATFSPLIGNDNANFDELLNFAKYVQNVSNRMYPGLCKDIIIKPYGRFNQYNSDYALLLEVGSNHNTIEEAQAAAKLIAEVLDVVIEGIKK